MFWNSFKLAIITQHVDYHTIESSFLIRRIELFTHLLEEIKDFEPCDHDHDHASSSSFVSSWSVDPGVAFQAVGLVIVKALSSLIYVSIVSICFCKLVILIN